MTPPDTAPEDTCLESRIERCRRVIDVLIDVGMKLVRALDPETGTGKVKDPALAFSRLSRALRLTLILDQRLDEIAAGAASTVAPPASLAATPGERDPDDAAGEGPDRSDPVEGARPERDRADPDEIGQALSRPMTELVGAICRDFGCAVEETDAAIAAFAYLAANDPGDGGGDHRPAAGVPPATARAPAGRQASMRRRDALGP